jgi:hypothetical protein
LLIKLLKFFNEMHARIDLPFHLKVEYGSDGEDLAELKQEIEDVMRDQLIFPSPYKLVSPGPLPHYEMKVQMIRKTHEQGQ